MERVAIVDYGMGNLRSVENALRHVAEGRAEILVTRDAQVVAAAERVVFPGQGAIRDCMAQIRANGLEACLREAVRAKPFLGICIGMQALMEGSDEDAATVGLAVFKGGCARFPAGARDPRTGERLKVPHMGWNQVRIRKPHPLWEGIDDRSRFYFVHSYFVTPEESDIVAATTDYAGEFVSGIARDTLFAVQFHPEKSQASGLRLLGNFLDWCP